MTFDEWVDGYFKGESHLEYSGNIEAMRAAWDAARRTIPEESVAQPKEEWLIWSNEHRAWWGPNQSGYYHHPLQAGRYTLERAKTITKSRSWDDRAPPETMIHIDAVVYGLPERAPQPQKGSE